MESSSVMEGREMAGFWKVIAGVLLLGVDAERNRIKADTEMDC
jgi:hypothetical protein